MKIKLLQAFSFLCFSICILAFAQPAPPTPAQPTASPQPPPPASPPQPQALPTSQSGVSPSELSIAAPQVQNKMPNDFELIAIKSYFKNKPRLGKLRANLLSASGEIIATTEGDLGDCKTCIRGASIKGKIGVRFYGKDLNSLRVSRKQSSSIQLQVCPTDVLLSNMTYTCEFGHKNEKMRLVFLVEP